MHNKTILLKWNHRCVKRWFYDTISQIYTSLLVITLQMESLSYEPLNHHIRQLWYSIHNSGEDCFGFLYYFLKENLLQESAYSEKTPDLYVKRRFWFCQTFFAFIPLVRGKIFFGFETELPTELQAKKVPDDRVDLKVTCIFTSIELSRGIYSLGRPTGNKVDWKRHGHTLNQLASHPIGYDEW